ncbi:hypothetical protein DXG03_003413 [Asterophora parasitica]|uniref:Protein-S-isoprenylcysteine O-methyltransferase n=1 Tax=Asterophora parasitica TaxID=117018 RepID=A0A9P7G151_9AGAR|nr:hypothetical protein DXG03_003413 [Asterophora parasitica]
MLALVVRFILVLAVSLAFHVAYTRPSEATSKERLAVVGSERFLHFVIKNLTLLKGFFWALGVAEATSLAIDAFAPTHSSLRLSSIFLKFNPVLSVDNVKLSPLAVVGALLVIFGGWLRWECYRTMKSLFTYELSIRDDHKLVTSGPYSVVRHPSYAAMLAVECGMYCWYAAEGSWLRESGLLDTSVGRVVTTVVAMYKMGIMVSLLRRVRVEDAELRKVFGAQWMEWARDVRYTIIPGII